ncbi:DUF4157 domain-containing protein [Streptomyces sp. NPDC057702]|uniref:eCIS core domain-containing protein n=1 Tax=unclassified Streptomyces TaxID=2593676 RepID=UPI0036B25A26
MHADGRAKSTETVNSRPTGTAPRHAAPPPPPLLALQREVGNAVVGQLLHRAERPAPGASVRQVLRTPGRPLDDRLRADMESRLGADFSGVRVHEGAAARASAADIDARAYTHGQHVVLGEGGGDRHTLAHELTHVIQQRQGPVAGTDDGTGLRISDPSDRHEREAEANAGRVMSGSGTDAQSAGTPQVTAVSEQRSSVQRAVENDTYLDDDDPNKADAREFFDAVDALTQAAYHRVVNSPNLSASGVSAKYLAHIHRWNTTWTEYVGGGKPKLMAARFGYAVEALVTSAIEASNPMTGFTIGAQVAHGSTRPDLVLRANNHAEIAWVDITASGSAGHIYDKGDWSRDISMFAEVTYPSVNNATLYLMRQNLANGVAMTAEELAERKAEAEIRYKEQKATWKALATEVLEGDVQNQVEQRTGLPPKVWELAGNKEKVQEAIAQILGDEFDAETPPPLTMVPSILEALGLQPKARKWGEFTVGFSVSTPAGDAWLVDHPHPRLRPDVTQP